MHTPTVSFIVPCYKLGHLLAECINSILSQSYGDFEILIMDDCSPDETPAVARSFQDTRIVYTRNDVNLGHLANYNKGIRLSRGRYVWLISADDYLRRAYILEKYVTLMDQHPRLGYVFCPGIGVRNGLPTQLHGSYGLHNDCDCIVSGSALLKRLLRSNFITAASGMARRECYESISYFPLDMPWAGDWYLWCVFALHFDVGYFREPMVCYRDHELSMTNSLFQQHAATCCEEDARVIWAVKRKADEATLTTVSNECLDAIGNIYARNIASIRYRMSEPALTLEQFEKSLYNNARNDAERRRVRSRTYAQLGNEYYWQGKRALAKKFYQQALKKDLRMGAVLIKRLLLSFGRAGDCLRKAVFTFREKVVQKEMS